MAILSADNLMEKIRTVVGDATDDNALSLIEDATDTLNDLGKKSKDQDDWKSKYEENDKQWRQKYKDRFFGKENDEDDSDGGSDDTKPNTENEQEKPLTFENLFKGE